jgi:hypothetical protein
MPEGQPIETITGVEARTTEVEPRPWLSDFEFFEFALVFVVFGIGGSQLVPGATKSFQRERIA